MSEGAPSGPPSGPPGRDRAALFLVDKPSGPTSHDIVRQVRRWTQQRRVGHGGTLDPLASGLLPVFVGTATRLSEYAREHRKRYAATIRLGQRTDTDDAQGALISEAPVPPFSATDLIAALERFHGRLRQTPPDYSAVKVGGVAAHRAARAGQALTLSPREVTISAIGLLAWEPPDLRVDLEVSAGTYIRALARDLGDALGCGAHVLALRRTAIGPLSVDEGYTVEALAAAFAEDRGWARAASPARFLQHWPQVRLSAEQAQRVRQGQALVLPDLPNGPRALALDADAQPLAVLVPTAAPGEWQPGKVLAPLAG